MSGNRDNHYYRFRLQGGRPGELGWLMGSVCVDGPYENKSKGCDEAACTMILDSYPFPANIDLAWDDGQRDSKYAAQVALDEHHVGKSEPLDRVIALAKDSVARLVSLISHGREHNGSVSVAVVKQADGLEAGAYYPRVWRPCFQTFENLDDLPHVRADARIAVRRLELLLEEVFSVVWPLDPSNHGAYGHRTRELLMSACTEVENAWRAVLDANHYPTQRQWNTTDYVKLASPLRLANWSLQLVDYPATASLEPFKSWSTALSTKSLTWYDAYNEAKHDRAKKFERATLWVAVEAIAAAWIMYGAQFGPNWVTKESRLLAVREHPFDGKSEFGYVAPKNLQAADFKPKDLQL